ncbi:MAG: hypothetical protein J6S67_11570, partial [Methanobrevibacter sp.]|nr:hypothetical protein [Methanobrevibacter sp.]
MKFKIWVCIALVSFICTLFTAFCGSAYTFDSTSLGHLQFIGDDYYNHVDFSSDSPVISSPASVPSGYTLVGYASKGEISGSTNRSRAFYIFAPSGTSSLQLYYRSNQDDFLITNSTLSGSSLYFVVNLFTETNNGVTTSVLGSSAGTGSHTSYSFNQDWQITSFVSIVDQNGNVTPIFQSEIGLSVISNNFHMDINVKPLVHNSIPYDVYLFPASLPVSEGTVSNIVSSPTYVSELSASQQLQIQNSPFADWLDTWQQEYNNTFGNIPVIARQIKFYAECQDTNFSTTFDPASYNLPFVKIMSGSIEQNLLIRNDVFSSQGGVYSLDPLCVVAVAHGSYGDSISRYDFSPSIFKYSTAPVPTSTHNTVTPQQQPVTDLQDLADYLKYLSTVNDGNDTIRDRNFIAMLGALPWSNFVGAGVGTGLTGWLPQLGLELDNIFGSLFDRWSNPSEEDLQELIDDLEDERAELRAKLAFVDDVKTEVLFVHSSILESGSTPPTFEVPLSVFWSGGSTSDKVIIINFESIPANVISAIKDVITV